MRTCKVISIIICLSSIMTAICNGAAYIKIGDIKGESTDEGHADEIDVLSWSWGLNRPTESISSGGGRSTSNARLNDFTIVKPVDKSSPLLFLSVCNGQHYPEAVFSIRDVTTGGKNDYIVIRMEDVIVSSISMSGSDSEIRPTENITLNYTKITFEFTPIGIDGQPSGFITASWDILSNKEG